MGGKACEIGFMSTNFRIEKRVGIQAGTERIWEVLTDFDQWHRWNPYESAIKAHLGFGAPVSLLEAIPGLPKREVQAVLGDWQPHAQLVWAEKRGFLFQSVRYYEIEELEPGSCIVANGFIFSGLRGEGFHDKNKGKIREASQEIGDRLKIVCEA